MKTLDDDLFNAVKRNFYLDSRNLNEIVQISNFGSQTCRVNVFNRQSGKYIRTSTIRTEERNFYERLSLRNLPLSLQETCKQRLEQLAKSEKSKKKSWKGVFERVRYSSGPGDNIFVYG